MSRNIAVRLQSEPGWSAVSYERSGAGGLKLRVHHVGGWGLDAALPGRFGSVSMTGVPLSLSGEILSDVPGFLGVVAPGEDLEDRLRSFRASLERPVALVPSPDARAVSSA